MRRLLLAALALTLVACSATSQRSGVTNAALPNDATITIVPFAPPTSVVSYDGHYREAALDE